MINNPLLKEDPDNENHMEKVICVEGIVLTHSVSCRHTSIRTNFEFRIAFRLEVCSNCNYTRVCRKANKDDAEEGYKAGYQVSDRLWID